MRIAVDAMGGDHGPTVMVPGAIAGARAFGVDLALVGRRADIEPLLRPRDAAAVDVEVIDAPDVIEMDEHPAQAVRRKPHASMVIALEHVRGGGADAMVSAGNSGALVAAALRTVGRIPGIERPAIAAFLPARASSTLLLDLGAVTDPKPCHLVQFAQMGSIYARLALGVPAPAVALLSNGEEPTKGNQLIQAAYPLMAADSALTFIGNIEGKDLLSGKADVVVADGFTGNVALKVAEGTAAALMDALQAELTRTPPRKLAALALRPAFRTVRSRLDYARFGGAPLLGVNGAVIIAHGRSNADAIRNAVGVARHVIESRLVDEIRAAITNADG